MSRDPQTKSEASAKTGATRRERLAAELRSNLHKRKARARNVEKRENQGPDGDEAHEGASAKLALRDLVGD
jgi:hypothetical protein